MSLIDRLRAKQGVIEPIGLLLLVAGLVAATIIGALAQRAWGFGWAIFATCVIALIAISVNLFLPTRFRREPPVSEDDLLAIAEAAVEDHAIEKEERELIEAVLELADTVVREIMTPRPDMVTLDASDTLREAADAVIEGGYSRLPVIGDDVDDVVGIVYAKDLLRAERSGSADAAVTTLMRPAVFVPETKRAHEQLQQMQESKFHVAIVVDEYGGTAGLVTLEDIIEEVLGEIVDEHDHEEPMLTQLSAGAIRVHGRMPVDELNDLIDADLPDDDWDTVGGLIFNALGRVPDVGESYEIDGYNLQVEQVEGRRITSVRVGRVSF
jgi:putative hemolysin